MANKRYSDEDILEQLRNLAEELGRTPSVGAINKASTEDKIVCAAIIYRRFGSLRNAQALAGLVPNESNRDNYTTLYSKEELIEQLKSFAEFLGRTPSCNDIETHAATFKIACVGTFQYRFGSFSKALAAAGFKDAFKRTHTSDKEEDKIFTFLRYVAKQTNGVIWSAKEFNKLAQKHEFGCSLHTLARHYGSVEKAFEAAGVTVTLLNEEARIEICIYMRRLEYITALQAYVNKFGHVPSVKRIQVAFQEGNFPLSYRTAYRLFGSWPEALAAAGLDVNVVLPIGPTGRPTSSNSV